MFVGSVLSSTRKDMDSENLLIGIYFILFLLSFAVAVGMYL